MSELALKIGPDPLRRKIILGPEPTDEDRHRARLRVCAAAESAEEAAVFLKMLGLL